MEARSRLLGFSEKTNSIIKPYSAKFSIPWLDKHHYNISCSSRAKNGEWIPRMLTGIVLPGKGKVYLAPFLTRKLLGKLATVIAFPKSGREAKRMKDAESLTSWSRLTRFSFSMRHET